MFNCPHQLPSSNNQGRPPFFGWGGVVGFKNCTHLATIFRNWAIKKVLGAPKGISKKNQQKAVLYKEYFNEGLLTVSEICERLNISRATYYKYLRHRGLSDKLRPYKK